MSKRRQRPTELDDPRLLPTYVGMALFKLIGKLPLNLLLVMGRGLGHLLWPVVRERRNVALKNIQLCFPELPPAAQYALAKAAFISTGEALLEMAAFFSNDHLDLDARLTVRGLHHLQQAQQHGRGVLFIGMHFNSIDAGCRLISKIVPLNAVYRPNNNIAMDRLIQAHRTRFAEQAIDRKDIRRMVRALRQGKVLWYAPDQDYGTNNAVFVPFFGVPAATITATSRLAKMGNAVVLPIAHYRYPGGKYRIEIGAPLSNFPSGDDHQDTALINTTIEHYVRQQPEQYLWVHKRFKHQPDGISPYKSN